jgi:AmmeMemoRadiSam system protein A
MPKVLPPEDPLNEEEKGILLKIARESVEHAVLGKPFPKRTFHQPHLLEERGAFVTLKIQGDLRGCIGQFISDEPLWKVVRDRARASALEDPRFPRVSPDEVPNLDIEISALTPLREIESVDEIEVGRHGIFITRGFCRGTLLPQVATEHGWDRETFLVHTCRKAGLPDNAWKDPETCIQIYAADVFGET